LCYNETRKGVNTMALKPLSDRIVAKIEKPLEKTASGILLGDAKEKPAYAVVESVGPDVKVVKKGDKIVYKEFSTTEIKVDNTDYIILKEEDVLATI
jgi:chaperonin GroES